MRFPPSQNIIQQLAQDCFLQARRSELSGRRGWRCLTWILLGTLALVGCSARSYRINADRETYDILAEKTADPRWSAPRVNVVPQRSSRFSDPFDPDRPPLPPDDPVAHREMHNPAGMKGYRHWHKDGDAAWIENPAWRESLALGEDGSFYLTRDCAVELALINSREYQTEIENLYLACLALTLQRFEFNLQWFSFITPSYFHFGKSPNETNSVNNFGNFGFRKAFAGGGQLIADFSNSLVWQFTGTDSMAVRSNIGVDLVQPLLRNAGRNIRLESLTQAERNVLYAARGFARFRKQFYFDVTSGNVGYLALLQRVQNIRNFEANVVALEEDLIAHKALNAAGLVSRLQVDQVFQSYQNSRLGLVRATNDQQTVLDQYKIRLGLPPGLPVKLDDSILSPFQFSDLSVEQTKAELKQLLANYREMETVPDVPMLQRGFEQLTDFQSKIEEILRQMPKEMEKAMRTAPVQASPQEQEWHDYRLATLQEAEGRLAEMGVEWHALTLDAQKAVEGLADDKRAENLELLQKLIRRQVYLMSELYVLQTRIRAYHLELEPVDLAVDSAVQIALENRLDLLNQRASVVDSWRNIQISANRLKGIVDIAVRGDIATEANSNKPFDFSSSASGYRAALRFDAPLNRQFERNAYRLQLIQYQRLRRQYMATEDNVVREVRRDIRDLATNRINFEIARQSLITAARQVEEAGDQLILPGPVSDSSHTQDSLNALNSMLQTKISLINIWVAYETTRVQLLLDLEALQPDPSVEPRDFYIQPAQEFP